MALGRPAASLEEWREIRAQVLIRAGWTCQACRVRTRLDVHHVVKRTQGGSDFDLDCHTQTDAPFSQGRLVITPLGDGQFRCEVVRGTKLILH